MELKIEKQNSREEKKMEATYRTMDLGPIRHLVSFLLGKRIKMLINFTLVVDKKN